MKKVFLLSLVLAISFFLVGCNYKKIQVENSTVKTINTKSDKIDLVSIKDGTYIIDNQSISLKNGVAESSASIGSSSKSITRYFGNEAIGDLNNDGKNDIAFLLTQENGGSGTFFYVAVGLGSDNGYYGLNAIFLGDRIAPQTTEIRNGEIIVNYADRNIGESFSVKPSFGVSKYFKVLDNKLIEAK